jgi:YD repeat-containing protein
MTLEEKDTPVTVSGFNEVDGNFTWVLNNTGNGNLNQCVAYLDAIAQTDDDINVHATNVTNGKRVGTWYSYDAQGRIVTRSGADTNGLYIYNIPTADQQRIVFTDDAGNTKTYPFQVEVIADVGAVAVADNLAWYHSFFLAAYNTSGAVTVMDATATAVKGNVLADHDTNRIIFPFDYDGDTVGGTAGTNKNCVFVCEGDGGATQAKTLYTISRITTVSFSCAPAQENNV